MKLQLMKLDGTDPVDGSRWIDDELPASVANDTNKAKAWVRDHGEVGATYRIIDTKYEGEVSDKKVVTYERRSF